MSSWYAWFCMRCSDFSLECKTRFSRGFSKIKSLTTLTNKKIWYLIFFSSYPWYQWHTIWLKHLIFKKNILTIAFSSLHVRLSESMKPSPSIVILTIFKKRLSMTMVVFWLRVGGSDFLREQSAPTKSPKHSHDPEKKKSTIVLWKNKQI